MRDPQIYNARRNHGRNTLKTKSIMSRKCKLKYAIQSRWVNKMGFAIPTRTNQLPVLQVDTSNSASMVVGSNDVQSLGCRPLLQSDLSRDSLTFVSSNEMQRLECASLKDKLRFAWSSSRSLFPNGLNVNSSPSTAMIPRQHSRPAFYQRRKYRTRSTC